MRAKHGKLTVKQQLFVDAYIETHNASEAYRRSYRAENMTEQSINNEASKLLKHHEIASRIRESIDKAASKAVIDRSWILERLMLNARMALGQEPSKVSRMNRETGEMEVHEVYNTDHAAAARSLELLGKLDTIGMFIDRSKVTVDTEFSSMTNEELLAYISRDASEAKSLN